MNFLVTLIFLAQFASMYQVGSLAGYGVRVTDILMLSAIIGFLYSFFILKPDLYKTTSSVPFFMVALVVSCLFSAATPLFSGSGGIMIQYLKTAMHLFFYMSFAFIFCFYKLDPGIWKKVIRNWLILSVFVNIFAIYQLFARAFDLPFGWLEFNNSSLMGRNAEDISDPGKQLALRFESFYRATGIFSEPSALASYNLHVLVFLLIPFIKKTYSFLRSKALFYVTLSLCFLGLLLSFSMTGMVGLSMILAALFFEKRINIRSILIFLLAMSIVIIAGDALTKEYFGISVLELFYNRILGIVTGGAEGGMTGESFYTRASSIDISTELWTRNPVTGVGLGQTYIASGKAIHFSEFSIFQVFGETGLLGTIAYLGLFVAFVLPVLRYSAINRKQDLFDAYETTMIEVCKYYLIILLLTNFISANLFISEYFWINIGIIFSVTAFLGNKYYAALHNKKALIASSPLNPEIRNAT